MNKRKMILFAIISGAFALGMAAMYIGRLLVNKYALDNYLDYYNFGDDEDDEFEMQFDEDLE